MYISKPVKMAIVGDGYFSPDLYDKYGHEYTSYGVESYILNRYINKRELCPNDKNTILFNDYFDKVSKCAKYVRSNMKEIADSYRVIITSSHICKVGRDDKYYIDRDVSIKYRYGYLDRFFIRSKNLFRDSGYTSNFTSPYKTGEDYKEEKRARDFFFQEYSYDEHCEYLRDEYQKESYNEENKYLEKKDKVLGILANKLSILRKSRFPSSCKYRTFL